MPPKFYAVRSGRTPGIYTTWAECESQTKGYSKAQFKSFPTKQQAEQFMSEDGTGWNHGHIQARDTQAEAQTQAKAQAPAQPLAQRQHPVPSQHPFPAQHPGQHPVPAQAQVQAAPAQPPASGWVGVTSTTWLPPLPSLPATAAMRPPPTFASPSSPTSTARFRPNIAPPRRMSASHVVVKTEPGTDTTTSTSTSTSTSFIPTVKSESTSTRLELIHQSIDLDGQQEDCLIHSFFASPIRHAYLYSDGASRGNPGAASCGGLIYTKPVKLPSSTTSRRCVIYTFALPLGRLTNNEAEYRGLLEGLKAARQMGITHLTAYADSELMCRQIRGIYRVHNENLLSLYEQCMTYITTFTAFSMEHIYREQNMEADAQCNNALESGQLRVWDARALYGIGTEAGTTTPATTTSITASASIPTIKQEINQYVESKQQPCSHKRTYHSTSASTSMKPAPKRARGQSRTEQLEQKQSSPTPAQPLPQRSPPQREAPAG